VSGRSLLASGRVELSCPDSSNFVWTRAAPNGRTVRILVRTRTTCLLVPNVVRFRTALIHRPDGDPTGTIKGPGRRISSLPHQKVSFWHLVSSFLRAFGFISPLLVFLCINLTFQVFFLSFSLQFIVNC
jgi:hypothetical protein